MKKLILTILIITTAISGYGQKSIDALFSRYAGDDGFVSITINANLLKLARALSRDDCNSDPWPAHITKIRLLVQEKDDLKTGNFYHIIDRELDRKNYEEFMRINNSEQDLVMFVRARGNNFKELLLVAGGEDNVLIQIKGNMTIEEAKKFADKVKKDKDVSIDIY